MRRNGVKAKNTRSVQEVLGRFSKSLSTPSEKTYTQYDTMIPFIRLRKSTEQSHVSILTPKDQSFPFFRCVQVLTSKVNCSLGLIISNCIFLTSAAKTASAGAVESIQLALTEIKTWPSCFKKWWAFKPTIRAWSGWATSAKMTSTMETSILYLVGWRASSTMAGGKEGVVFEDKFSQTMLIKVNPTKHYHTHE